MGHEVKKPRSEGFKQLHASREHLLRSRTRVTFFVLPYAARAERRTHARPRPHAFQRWKFGSFGFRSNETLFPGGKQRRQKFQLSTRERSRGGRAEGKKPGSSAQRSSVLFQPFPPQLGKMPLEVVVELHIHAITCPGVFLPEKKGLVLGVCIFGQYRETQCFPAVFPLMILEVMKFDKIFVTALDPAAVAELLETYRIRFELIQLIYPDGELLAYYEENTRDFLFPEPRLTPLYPGKDRELLMKTPLGFPGISPKIEFSTMTAIKELSCPLKRLFEERLRQLRPSSASCFKGGFSPQLNALRARTKEDTCERMSKSLRSRSPSPHVIRRLCQEERPVHSSLVSRGLKSLPENKPPFVVRHVDSSKPFGEQIPFKPNTPKSRKKIDFTCFDFPLKRASSLDSMAADLKGVTDPEVDEILERRNPCLRHSPLHEPFEYKYY
uniref:Spermatogenesis-associated protein 6 N-terminal domain-containing protein n=1 Tax=Monodelphis domestica TaxID=13616 RepID=A0A5F8GVG6_MONDO